MYKFVDVLPIVNLTDDILILNTAKNSIKKDWFAFCDHFISHELKHTSLNKKPEIRNYKEGSNNFVSFSGTLKNLFGFGNGLDILDFKYTDGIYSILVTTDYEKMISMYNDSSSVRINGKFFTPISILTRFFVYQRYHKKLLFPITTKAISHFKYDFSKLFKTNKLYLELHELILKSKDKKYARSELKTLDGIISCCLWSTKEDIMNEDINQFQTYCFKNKDNIVSFPRKISVLNKIRLYLLESGVSNIDTPNIFTNSIRKNPQTIVYDMKKDPFEWLSIDKTHKLFSLKTDANLYLQRLYIDGIKTATRKKYMVAINHMFKYIIKEQEDFDTFDENTVNSMFDVNNKNTFFKYLQLQNIAEGSQYEALSVVNKFLQFCGLITPFAKRNIPKRKKKRRTITSRDAMPQEMLNELKKILTTNPPKPSTVWEPSKANLDWWKFKDIYPVQPLMMLMHLNIPIRGGQLRHLCRNKSLVFNHDGNLERFIINTDKNVNRDTLQEIPNVWEELNILKDYLQWNKEYYPTLPQYKYNNEENTPWEDIEPLFLIPNSLQPITPFQHKVYLIKLLCTYQIKINNAYQFGYIKYKSNVAWKKDSKEFFRTIEELNQANDTYLIKKIQVAYNIHAIRVTGITRYLYAGVNLNVLLMLTGHVDYNMIVNVYTKFTQEEKKEILQSAVQKLRFDQPEELVNNVESFIFNEIPCNYDTSNPKDIKKAFKENGLFSMKRKASTLQDSLDIDSGINIASIKHPTSWFPMISGICPGVQCPEGRERKCSLCSYFITGRLFLDGIIHMANLAMTSFVRLSKEHEQDKKVSTRYSDTKATKLELLVEEIMGWHEILDKIESDITKSIEDNSLMLYAPNKVIEAREVNSNLAYLENCYHAKLMGVEQDDYGLKLLTIKAIQFAQSMNEEEKVVELINDNVDAIDYLMEYYIDPKKRGLLTSFIKEISEKK
ncbi:hypothetical protein CPG37_02775 [Malaciobacter canalis]|uniref:Tyr recombinase domain-containing protein n=1 Tax=Malaciobacter canalis TaxID=1912871 RepID=A0ABX4LS41_9BACT|nr:tyrosine-type recombinase/integrase [Malaciobacter canalis]PHO10785.1 hypothetical protein CPG37_02775 [Malaciobacter canalis]QEE33942.1 hypothetical protein ACAN_2504 [Malaciobacter canalis]